MLLTKPSTFKTAAIRAGRRGEPRVRIWARVGGELGSVRFVNGGRNDVRLMRERRKHPPRVLSIVKYDRGLAILRHDARKGNLRPEREGLSPHRFQGSADDSRQQSQQNGDRSADER